MCRRLIILMICLIFTDYTVANTSIMADTHIYKGRYTNSSDIILTYGGPVPVPFLMMGVL